MFESLTAELRQLSAVIGHGRHSAGVSATFIKAGGEGIYLPLQFNGQECGLWLSQSCWQHWLAYTLATDDAPLLAAELVNAMAHWAVSPLLASLPELVIHDTPPQAVTLLTQWAVGLTFELEGQQLSVVLCHWPPVALIARLSHWQSEALPAQQDAVWQAGLVVGWSHLSLHQLQQIRPGEGVRILAAAELEQGNCWLWQRASAQIYIKLEDGNKMTIQQVNDDIDRLLALDIATVTQEPPAVVLEQLPQTLVMEIGRLTLPLSDIKQLAVGQTLDCKTAFYGEVNIRLHGQSVGSGSLLCCDEQLIVRIEQWFLTSHP